MAPMKREQIEVIPHSRARVLDWRLKDAHATAVAARSLYATRREGFESSPGSFLP
jgi:hypothetical protein